MAVYTHLGTEQLTELVAAYDVGDLVSAKGIAEGVSNSNWFIETTQGQYILTMYERRIDTTDLPFFLGLLDHLSAKGCPVPRTIHDRTEAAWREVDGKAVALIEFLPGVSPSAPTKAQAQAVGEALARIHLAALSYTRSRKNDLSPHSTLAVLAGCGNAALEQIDNDLPQAVRWGESIVRQWPDHLPSSVVHSDLFADNVLMLGSRVTGLIDFYFACNDMMAYDLAVTHAAWCFDQSGTDYSAELGQALIAGYETIRTLEAEERTSLPLLAQGACLRFVASRAQDWIETPTDALVTRKDPMDFVRRWKFYRHEGKALFA